MSTSVRGAKCKPNEMFSVLVLGGNTTLPLTCDNVPRCTKVAPTCFDTVSTKTTC